MSDGPVVDGRDQQALLEDLHDLAAQYTDQWDPDSPDNGTVLLQIASRFGADVLQRLESVPEKHRLAFLDELGFDREPPQAARLPLSVTVSSDLDRNVAIPGGTQAVAETADGEQIFEIPQDGGFEATPASIAAVYSVDPADDRIVEHSPAIAGSASTTLFTGDDQQSHVLYLGHEDLLTLDSGSTLAVSIETDADPALFTDVLTWEYYGEDEHGVEEWHEIDPGTEEAEAEGDELDSLQARLESLSAAQDADEAVTVAFTLPGETSQTDVEGIQSRWLRCRAPAGEPACFRATVSSVSLRVARDVRGGGIQPSDAFSDDVPLAVDGEEDITPFGTLPQPPSTFYLASEEAFTKAGAVVDVSFGPPASGSVPAESDGDRDSGPSAGVLGGPPTISWEYWNGSGWTRLDVTRDETNSLCEAGHLQFTVPEDLERTSVSGHEDVWIRARLVSGNYGRPAFDVTAEGERGELTSEAHPPRFGGVRLHYDRGGESFEHVLTVNNATVETGLADAEQFQPFVPVPDDAQTLYLGFDEVLKNGPLTVFVPVADATYPRTFDPGIRWEYCVDPADDEWAKLDVRDETAGLTERGIVSVTVPQQTTAFERFGERAHWVRLRVTEDRFETGSVSSIATDTVPEPPVVDGVYLNTQWAANTRTIEDEIPGSSDGAHDQVFECASVPVIDIEVWVDEQGSLSASQQQTLQEERPEAVERATEPDGSVSAFWVRWTAVEDFLDSGPQDRHYVVDRTSGTVSFGDGQHGRVPPSGQDNVRATYTTGGGSEGNVECGAVTDLRSSISLVESVTNHAPADGGAAAESPSAVASRAPAQLKTREKAVSASDFEAVAMAVTRELAKVTCEPEMTPDGEREPGWVTLLIVPEARREQPVPSLALQERIQRAVSERAPATLVAQEGSRIVVRGPSYAAVSVDASVRTDGVKSISTLKSDVESALDDYLHPLTGRGGEGWSFGTLPAEEALAERLAAVDGVDAVLDLTVAVETGGDSQPVAHCRADGVARDTLVCSGEHDIAVTMEGLQ
jgi:hypothetical protein